MPSSSTTRRAASNLPLPSAKCSSTCDAYRIESTQPFQPENIMRPISLIALACLSFSAYAQPEAPARAEPPPPPPMSADDAADEPQVTITKQTEQTVEEYRMNGKLYMIKITPKHGVPYYLVDDKGDGKFARQESM